MDDHAEDNMDDLPEDADHGPEQHDPLSDPIHSARRRARGLRPDDADSELDAEEASPSELPLEAAAGASPSQGGPRMIGKRYRLERRVGRGGMGVVWLGRDLALNEPVALKFLPKELGADPTAAHELREEARVMRDLTHPNIVRLYDVRFYQGRPFLVQAFMFGGSLEQLMRSRPYGAFTLEETMWALREIAQGLSYAHEQGVTHRDIKPANLLLSKAPTGALGGGGESLRVADFGLAFTAAQALSRSSGYRPSGTLAYMAPEILLGRQPTPAADVYSLASTIYCLIHGVPPFSTGDIPTQILQCEPPELNSGRKSLDQAVSAAMEKAPEDRPASVEEFLAIAEGSGAHRLHVGRARGRSVGLIAGGALGAVALLALGALGARHWFSKDEAVDAAAPETAAVPPEAPKGSVPATSPGGPEEDADSLAAVRVEEVEASPTPSPEPAVEEQRPTPAEATRKAAPAESSASRRSSAFTAHAATLAKARTAEEVRDLVLEARGDGLADEEWSALCEASLESLRRVLEAGTAKAPLAATLERLAVVGDLATECDCVRAAEWERVASSALRLPEPASYADSPLASALGDARELRAYLASAESHVLRGELETLLGALLRRYDSALDAALGREGPGFLGVLALAPEGSAPELEPSLASARQRLRSLGAPDEAELEAWIQGLATYLAEDGVPLAEEARGALRGLLDAHAERLLDEAGPYADELLAAVEQLDELLVAGGLDSGAVPKGLSRRIATILGESYKRNEDLLVASHRYLALHPESRLVSEVEHLASGALEVVLQRVDGVEGGRMSRSHWKKLRAVIEIADELLEHTTQLERELGRSDGEGTGLREAYAVVRARVAAIVAEDRAELEKRYSDAMSTSKRASKLSTTADDFERLAKALESSDTMAEELSAMLPSLVRCLHKDASEANRKWRQNENIKNASFSKREYNRALEWAVLNLTEARENESSLHEALVSVIELHHDYADLYASWGERQYRKRGGNNAPGNAAPAHASDDALDVGIEHVDQADQFIEELATLFPRAEELPSLRAASNELRRRINGARAPDERR